jgi:hypothetical protein
MKQLLIVALVTLVVIPFQAEAKDGKSLVNNLYLQQGERFTVVCDYPDAQIEYGYNGSSGLVGYCD